MSFNELLDYYMNSLNVSPSVFARKCGISQSALSRYRSGKRVPSENSDIIKKLAQGVETISAQKGCRIPIDRVTWDLKQTLLSQTHIASFVAENINFFIYIFDISVYEFARYLNYTIPHITNMMKQRRSVAEPEKLSRHTAEYIISISQNGTNQQLVERITKNASDPIAALEDILNSNPEYVRGYILQILSEIDGVNFGNYLVDSRIVMTDFHEMGIAKKTKFFTGKLAIEESRLLFCELSRTIPENTSLYLMTYDFYPESIEKCSWMTIKKAQFLFFIMLKKHTKIYKICYIPRDEQYWQYLFKLWIPLSLCGEVYLYGHDETESISKNTLMVSQNAAFTGNVYPENPEVGTVFFFENKKCIKQYYTEAEMYLKHSRLLMENLPPSNKYTAVMELLKNDPPEQPVQCVNSPIVLLGMTSSLFNKIAQRNEKILPFRSRYEKLVKKLTLCLELYLSHTETVFYLEQYQCGTMPFPLFNAKSEPDCFFTIEEYTELLNEFREKLRSFPNVRVAYVKQSYFTNIYILFSEKWAFMTGTEADSRNLIVREKFLIGTLKKLFINNEDTTQYSDT